MDYNWSELSNEIFMNVESDFTKVISIDNEQLREVLNLFEQVVTVKCNSNNFNGLTRTLLPALNQLYVDNSNHLSALRTIAGDLEPFIKKVILLVEEKDYSNNKNKTLAKCIDELGISERVSNRAAGEKIYKILGPENTESLDEITRHISRAYQTRNDHSHENESLPLYKIYTYSQSILIVILFIINNRKDALKKKIDSLPNTLIGSAGEYEFNEREKVLFSFIAFGNQNNEIKNTIIDSFILNELYKDTNLSLSDIKNRCNNHLKSKLDEKFFKRRVHYLKKSNKIISENQNDYSLSNAEKITIEKCIENYNNKYNELKISISNIIKNII